MQSAEFFGFYFFGFSIIIAIVYYTVKLTGRGRERFVECYAVLAVGLIVEQLSALYWGIRSGNVLAFYLSTWIMIAPLIFLMSIDLVWQKMALERTEPRTPTSSIAIE